MCNEAKVRYLDDKDSREDKIFACLIQIWFPVPLMVPRIPPGVISEPSVKE